ncbi:Catalase-related peroxidase [Cytospora mali]|uniref:Catalase-related peroxidase n=1 Tax=Cytospora mali TaxID=578113 RepID=A0A194UQ36_CYTMA|nr:Catalase-related peroxidase [Valsa mali var. pyri (nom. inval.)]
MGVLRQRIGSFGPCGNLQILSREDAHRCPQRDVIGHHYCSGPQERRDRGAIPHISVGELVHEESATIDEGVVEKEDQMVYLVLKRELPTTMTPTESSHAKGILLNGTFTPTEEARSLSIAPHLTSPQTPIIARFSDAAGDPAQAETEAGNKPKGLAALAFFKASRDGTLAEYLPAHPKAQAFQKLPSPFPVSFATARFFGVNAVKLVDGRGEATFVRYRVEPVAGAKRESPTYLVDGVPGLIEQQGPIAYRLTAQVAAEGDVTDDCTVRWPESRRVVELGTISLEGIVEDSGEEEKHILFDPLPKGVPGLEPSGDPLLNVRSLVYRMSARERGAF